MKYKVTWRYDYEVWTTVQADSKEEAIQKAIERIPSDVGDKATSQRHSFKAVEEPDQ